MCSAVFVGKPQTEPEVKLLGCGLPQSVASEGQQKQHRGGRECQQGNYISQPGEPWVHKKTPHIFIVKVKRDARQTEEEVTPNVQRSEV